MKQYYCLIIFALFLWFTQGCREEEEILPKPVLTLTATNPTAYGAADGSILLSVEGLEEIPYLTSWNTGATTPSITGLKAGVYSVKVIYLEKAVANRSITLTEPSADPLELSFSVKQPAKWGYRNGSVTLTVKTGVPPFTFTWSNGQTTQNLKDIGAGIYTVTVKDSHPHSPVTTIGNVVVGQPDFVCSRDSLMDVDGFLYPTVQLGDQCWTAVNIRTIHKPGWDPKNPNLIEKDYRIEGRFCQGNYCSNEYGAHYTWPGVVNGQIPETGQKVQGIAPDGWRIPTLEDWTKLNDWLKIDGNGGPGTNVPNKIRGSSSSSGFNVLYAGNWGYGVFSGELGAFWTSAPLLDADGNPAGRAYYRLVNNLPLLGQGHDIIEKGLSVRLIKND